MAKKKKKRRGHIIARVKAAAPEGLFDELWGDYVKWCERKGLKP